MLQGVSLEKTYGAVKAVQGLSFQVAPGEVLSEPAFRELERRNLLTALRRCDYRVAGERGAAKLLGLSPSTLTYRMKQLGLEKPR